MKQRLFGTNTKQVPKALIRVGHPLARGRDGHADQDRIGLLNEANPNCLLHLQKLLSKENHGAKGVKEHDAALTQRQRAAGHPSVRKRPVVTMDGQTPQTSGDLPARSLPRPNNLKLLPKRKPYGTR